MIGKNCVLPFEKVQNEENVQKWGNVQNCLLHSQGIMLQYRCGECKPVHDSCPNH